VYWLCFSVYIFVLWLFGELSCFVARLALDVLYICDCAHDGEGGALNFVDFFFTKTLKNPVVFT
jgi:hypothetical protein